MRAYEIHGGFGLDHLVVAERARREPGPGEVVVELASTSLNRRDLMMIEGAYNPRQKLPLIPVSDGVGRIRTVGPGVASLKPGDRVAPLFCQRWQGGPPSRDKLRNTLGGPLDGVLCEERVLAEDGVVPVPEHLTDDEAATLPCAGVTAWSAVVESARVRPGETVLVLGTGGVSLFALQFAKLCGAHVTVTSSSDEKLERARALGADTVIHYARVPAWDEAVREATGGVDHVIEVGGAGTLERSIRATKLGGSIQLVGVLAGKTGPLDLTPVFMGHRRIQGLLVGSRDTYLAMAAAIGRAKLRPVIDRTFAFDEARAALERMSAGAHFGKICVRVR